MRKLKNEELNRISLNEYKNAKKNPLVVVLDNIRSQSNIGSVFRTSDAFAVKQIVLCGITANPPQREIHKTALGATDSVDWEYKSTTIEAVTNLRDRGYKIISIEQTEHAIPLPLFEIEKNKKYALVFGNEINGVEDAVIQQSDFCIEIPQWGTKHSLNISVSVGIVLWDILLKLK
ncbi:MAG: RNA methyltransferase [Bacteroidetes bacterium HGW-Bacteroidetes-16]|jgi:tRNA G18 (ribose-2'-O)-methylase SpoU|nr:MAG: RNA methyltransferase [Bacteroidetes bacterium HGW-Bacteroidetes-16]